MKRFVYPILCGLIAGLVCFYSVGATATISQISGFVNQADGNTLTAATWNQQVGAIYNYINSILVATWNELNTKGGVLTYDGSNIQQLTPGTNGQVLTANSAAPYGINWASIANTTALTSTGDILTYGSGALQRLGAGSDGQVLTARSTATFGIDWENGAVPSGTIVMWPYSVATIPTGWALCDGVHNTNGTYGVGPNLQGLYVVGAGNNSPPATGGMGLMNPGGPYGDASAGAGLGPSHFHALGAGSLGVTSGSSNIGSITFGATVTPRYFALNFIQKL